MSAPKTELASTAALARTFRDPPPEYGPIDGWWWEAGRLDKEKMRWQLEELKDKGISGTWFYARYVHGEPLGSDPAYFTDEWWDFTRYSAEEHERLGLTSWFSNWTVLQFEQDAIRAQRGADPDLWGRKLVIHSVESQQEGPLEVEIDQDDEILDAAAYHVDGDSLDYSTRLALADPIHERTLAWVAPGPGWVLAVVAARPWDLNYVGPDVADRWTDVILGEYERRLPEQMGKIVEAFGPDEMMFLDGTTIFSREVLSIVQSKCGYDPTPYLVGLFHDIGPKTDQIRCAYYDAMVALLEKNFYQPLTRWLHERQMLHVSLSQVGSTPLAQTFYYGDFFRYLGSFDVPGNEDPGWKESVDRRLYHTKLSSSIAHLGGRQRAIVLAHYGAGWGQTFEQNLAWTNAAYAKGLNLYSRHQAAYSLMGGWYEWVPPADHFYHPYWCYWKPFADYVRRLSFVMSQGKHRADVALLYPLTTIYANWVAGRVTAGPEGGMDLTGMGEKAALEGLFDPPAREASDHVIEIAKAIYLDGIDFDFVNDSAFERATVNGKILEISGLEFRSIVLPPVTTIPIGIAELMKHFYDAGGTVGAYGRLPWATAENGRDDPRLRVLIEHIFGVTPSEPVSQTITRTNANGGHAFFVPEDVGQIPEAISRAIVRDVVVSGKGTFHTHQKVGELDVYLLTNTEDQARDVTARLRVDADAEIWDPFTGDRRPVHRATNDGETTELRIRMEPYEGIVLVCSPRGAKAEVLQDDFSELANLNVEDPDAIVLRGFDGSGGTKKASVRYRGHSYEGEADVVAPPEPITVDGPFSFRLEPTMDNRWGDFRYPPSESIIGAEARRFRYQEETDVPGTELGWHGTHFADTDWEEVTYSYGPYWWHLRPSESGSEPDGLLDLAKQGDGSLPWQPYTFSKKFGSVTQELVGDTPGWEHLLGVSENFLLLGEGASPEDASDPAPTGSPAPRAHYLRTTIEAPEARDYLFLIGRNPPPSLISLSAAERKPFAYRVPTGTQAWINGDEVLAATEESGPEIEATVSLKKGRNIVLLRVVEPTEGQPANYAAFLQSKPEQVDPHTPLLTWFREAQQLVYDITPDKERRFGWYRFDAPPGVQEMRLHTSARHVEAWIDGKSVPVRDGTIALGQARSTVSRVALRVEQEPGTYAGAVFDEPVAFTCATGTINVGDWSQFGLATYSGIGVYSTEIALTTAHLTGKVILDLGRVTTVADVSVNGQPAGVKLARPFRFDITDLVSEGQNRIEIKVANTLANHMSTYPTIFVRDGQTVSGLLGPVQLRFLAPVRLIAEKNP